MATHLLSLLLLAAVMPDSQGSAPFGGRRQFRKTPGLQQVVFKGHGNASASSNWPDHSPSKAFQSGRDFWVSGTGSIPQVLWFRFTFPRRVVGYSINSRPDRPALTVADGPSQYSFWASNYNDCSDHTQWVILHEDKSGPFGPNNDPKRGSFSNNNFFHCYGFIVTAVPGRKPDIKYAAIANVKFSEIPSDSSSNRGTPTNPGLHSFRAA